MAAESYMTVRIGDRVQTPLGKGVVTEVRNEGRLLVDVQGMALRFNNDEVSPIVEERRAVRSRSKAATKTSAPSPDSAQGTTIREIDLHGLTVEQAMSAVDSALNDAMLADVSHLRVVHGRSGGKIRAALHRRLGELPNIKRFALDPRNEGVTVVALA